MFVQTNLCYQGKKENIKSYHEPGEASEGGGGPVGALDLHENIHRQLKLLYIFSLKPLKILALKASITSTSLFCCVFAPSGRC